MNHPLISIIVPVYKVEPYMARCLESLIGQTFKDIEIICVNDGSPDRAPAICEEYARRDLRITVISQVNQGRSAARNTGLLHAKGTYIQFCDSDDFYDLAMCEKMYNAITTSNADIATAGTKIIYDGVPELSGDHEYYRIKFNGLHDIDDEIIQKTDVSVWNKIFRKSIIDKYNIRFPVGLNNEDACFTPKYYFLSKTIYFLDEALYNYIRHPNSIMSDSLYSKTPLAVDHVNILYNIKAFMDKHELNKKYENVFFWMVYTYIYYAIGNGTEDIYQKAMDIGFSFYKDFDYNVIMSAANNKDDIVRLYAIKNNDLDMFLSVDKAMLDLERSRMTYDKAMLDLERSRMTYDKAMLDLERSRMTYEGSFRNGMFLRVLKSCFLFPWYIYKTYLMVYNRPVPNMSIKALFKAYLFPPCFVLKTYLTMVKRSQGLYG
jgi:glycosyltransferase involved in cell wall biosynthesis